MKASLDASIKEYENLSTTNHEARTKMKTSHDVSINNMNISQHPRRSSLPKFMCTSAIFYLVIFFLFS